MAIFGNRLGGAAAKQRMALGKRSALELSLFGVASAFYLLFLLWNAFHAYKHIEPLLLTWRYFVILPLLIGVLRNSVRSNSPALSFPAPRKSVMVMAFALCTAIMGWYSAGALFNPDESGYNFQARIFAAGHMSVPPLPGAVSNVRTTPAELHFENHIMTDQLWFAKFPPGWPALLSIGYKLKARWIVNPLLAALLLSITFFIGCQFFSGITGRFAVLFAVLSPFCFVNSFNMMSHTSCAVFESAACGFLLRGLRKKTLGPFVGMFAMIAASFQIRPFTAFIFGSVFTCAALWYLRKERRLLTKVLALAFIFGSFTVLGVGIYNKFYTGVFWKSPYAMSVGSDAPQELSLSARKILVGVSTYGRRSFQDTLLYAFPFVFLLALYALLKENLARREATILAAAYLALVMGYALHPNGSGVHFGERFHYEAFFGVCLLAARGFEILCQNWKPSRTALTFAVSILAILQLTHEACVAHEVSKIEEPFRHVRTVAMNLNQPSVIFLHDGPDFTAKHFNLNEVDWLSATHIYLVDAEPEHRAEWTCQMGYSDWDVLGYDLKTHTLIRMHGHTQCR